MTSQSLLFSLTELPGGPEDDRVVLTAKPVLQKAHLSQLCPHLDDLVFSAMESGELEPVLKLLRQVRDQRVA